jgi:hypothetical protein
MTASSADSNAKIIDEFHANGGRVGGVFEGTPLLLLHHTGAKSGKSLVNPVGYLSDGGRYVVVASNGGAPDQSRLVPQRHRAPQCQDRGRDRDDRRCGKRADRGEA